ncbi:hypothetical protein TraAM80_05304 [Trypanosoma rangeli]|uniref:Uncharacterized protein n=1 Tax=Trypanosoma rangeli TaxID=5698 RepID=A0A3R7ME58_TRYRA|nr:uncharacterized protein TraAM80_05304 [Trypanosoma rangeli]RNF04152.1 hypothetical protein TraAM80_05304 [Trypanosoma rangeli]|eukprot:RNF04152.1 hypothetical protein TraAM80_05304 [Trypanosoma rangeli]
MNVPSADATCLATIIDSVQFAMQEGPIAEGRVVDLLALIPEVFRADTSGSRMIYLMSVCQPLATVVRLMHPSLQSPVISMAAMSALLEFLTWCVELPEFPTVAAALTSSLMETSALHTILDALLNNGNEVMMFLAAELLFLLVARFSVFGDALGETVGALARISAFVLDPGAPLSKVREYLAGVLRICAGLAPSKLPPTFLPEGLVFLAAHTDEQSRMLLLVSGCVEVVANCLPQLYLQHVRKGKCELLTNIVSMLASSEGKRRQCLVSLLGTLLRVEGEAGVVDIEHHTAAYKAILAGKQMWISQQAVLRNIDVMFFAVHCALTEVVQTHISSALVRVFPYFCRTILEGAQTSRRHATLVLALALAKHPPLRSTVLNLTRTYAEWSGHLLQCITDALSGTLGRSLAIVDATGIVLNDPATLPSDDTADINAWADSVLVLQEQRGAPRGGSQEGVGEALERIRCVPPEYTFFFLCSGALLTRACQRSFLGCGVSKETTKKGYKQGLWPRGGGFRKQKSGGVPVVHARK